VEVIKETVEASTIGCIKWVINLEEPKESVDSDISEFGSVSVVLKHSRSRKFVYYESGLSTKS
jgi:hypothetical protein